MRRVGIRGVLARHRGDESTTSSGGLEDGLKTSGDSRPDATDRRLLAPAVEALGVSFFARSLPGASPSAAVTWSGLSSPPISTKPIPCRNHCRSGFLTIGRVRRLRARPRGSAVHPPRAAERTVVPIDRPDDDSAAAKRAPGPTSDPTSCVAPDGKRSRPHDAIGTGTASTFGRAAGPTPSRGLRATRYLRASEASSAGGVLVATPERSVPLVP